MERPTYPYASFSRDEHGTRAILTTDHCTMDQKTLFLGGCLEIPIINKECHPERGAFSFRRVDGLWVGHDMVKRGTRRAVSPLHRTSFNFWL